MHVKFLIYQLINSKRVRRIGDDQPFVVELTYDKIHRGYSAKN